MASRVIPPQPLSIWAKLASSIRTTFQPTPNSSSMQGYGLSAVGIIKMNINATTIGSLFILFAIATIPVVLFMTLRKGVLDPRQRREQQSKSNGTTKNIDYRPPYRMVTTSILLGSLFILTIVTSIIGIQTSVLLPSSVSNTRNSINNFSQDTKSQLEAVNTTSVLNTLNGTLKQSLDSLVGNYVNKNDIATTLSNFQSGLDQLNTSLISLNEYSSSLNTTTVHLASILFKSQQDLVDLTSALTSLNKNLIQPLPQPQLANLSLSLTALARILSLAPKQASPLLLSTINTNPDISQATVSLLSPNISNYMYFPMTNITRFLDDVSAWNFSSTSYVLGSVICLGILLGLGSVVVGTAAGQAGARRIDGMKIITVFVGIVSGFLMLCSGGVWVFAVLLGQSCQSINDISVSLLSSIDTSVSSSVQKFLIARDNCLTKDGTSFLDFAVTMGFTNASTTNISDIIYPFVENWGVEKFGGLQDSDYIPPAISDLMTTSSFQDNLNSLVQMTSSAPSLESSINNITNYLTIYLATLSPLLSSLSDANSNGNLAASLKPPSSNVDIISFLTDLKTATGLSTELSQHLDKFNQDLVSMKASFQGINSTISFAQSLYISIRSNFTPASGAVSNFVDRAKTNLSNHIPEFHDAIYSSTKAAMTQLGNQLECKNRMEDSVVIQKSVCLDLSHYTDSLWLCLALSGLATFICLCALPCIVSNITCRPSKYDYSQSSRSLTFKNRCDSVGSTVALNQNSASTLVTSPDARKSKKFGKANPVIKVAKHALDLIPPPAEDPLSPQWVRFEDVGHNNSVSEPQYNPYSPRMSQNIVRNSAIRNSNSQVQVQRPSLSSNQPRNSRASRVGQQLSQRSIVMDSLDVDDDVQVLVLEQ